MTCPQSAIVILNSRKRISIARLTPASPLYCETRQNLYTKVGPTFKRTARPQIGMRPAKQKSAPRARALKMSDPRLIPPSTAILILLAATGAHSLNASSVAGTPSNCRPP